MAYIESGLFNSDMQHPEFEIHHRRDDIESYHPSSEKQPIQLHHHDFYEVYYFISGNVDYLVENKTYHLHPGDLLLMSPLELHQPVFREDSGIYERIVLWIDGKKLSELSNSEISFLSCFKQSQSDTDAHLYHIKEEKQKTLQYFLDELISTTQADNKYSSLIANSLLTMLLCNFHKLASQDSNAKDHRRMSVQIANCVDYINMNLDKNLSLDLLAKECFISKQHLLRTFKEAMGFSVHQYIQKKRLLMARQYMQNGDSPKEAAMKCGFSDYSVFYRAYRKEYGKSPSKN
ncbi:MAG: helix-turn-helix domain-containing protein [Lachnospiraceae bacterium]|nr:helix-turn-helix domain-containing protein [Lachnospiraceae bacterium]